MSFTIRSIVNVRDPNRAGLLTRFDQGGRATLQSLIRGDGSICDFRFVVPSATPQVRLWDDLDCSSADIKMSVGIPDQDPWFYGEDFSPVAITPVDCAQPIVGSGTENSVQLIILGEGVYGGTFTTTLTLKNSGTGDGGSDVATPIVLAATDTAEQILAKLLQHPEAVKTGVNGLSVSGPVGGPFTIETIAHQGKRAQTALTVADINLLVPRRMRGMLEQQTALAAAFASAGTRTLTGGIFEAQITFPGDEPSTVLQVPLTVGKDLITNAVANHSTAGAFRFLPEVTGYLGSTSAQLQGIPTAGRSYGVVVFNHFDDGIRFYQLVAGNDATDSPGIIRPADWNADTNARVWKAR